MSRRRTRSLAGTKFHPDNYRNKLPIKWWSNDPNDLYRYLLFESRKIFIQLWKFSRLQWDKHIHTRSPWFFVGGLWEVTCGRRNSHSQSINLYFTLSTCQFSCHAQHEIFKAAERRRCTCRSMRQRRCSEVPRTWAGVAVGGTASHAASLLEAEARDRLECRKRWKLSFAISVLITKFNLGDLWSLRSSDIKLRKCVIKFELKIIYYLCMTGLRHPPGRHTTIRS